MLTENLDDFIPNLTAKLTDRDGNQFVYLAIVQGEYLDKKVNNFRTDFDISALDTADVDAEIQLSLLPDEIVSKSNIRSECLKAVEAALSDYIKSLNDAKIEKIIKYVKDEAPQYKPLMRYRDEFINNIAPNATKQDMEMALHKELHQREVEFKRDGNKISTASDKLDDFKEYRNKLSSFIERSGELGASALAHYVMHRKIIIEFLEKAISVNNKNEKYPLGEAVHNIIFPMRSTDQDILYSQQNLWLIDERLTFHTYISSDKPLKSNDFFESDSAKRPDIFIFDRKIAFSEPVEDGSPINSVVVVEFKRPQRDNYTGDSNPLDQVFSQISDIRAGTFKNENGRPIRPSNSKIPAFAYVVCDITDSLVKVLLDRDASVTPDGLSYYGYHRTYQIYYEVVDYGKLVTDAKKRNRIFFERLNISS